MKRLESMSMNLNDDLVAEIISYLPLKLAIQCKVISKNFNRWISDPKFCKTLFQHQKLSTLVLAYKVNGETSGLQKYFKNLSIPTIDGPFHTEPFGFRIVAESKGLLLLVFSRLGLFCIFNPITGAHQFIPYPDHYRRRVIDHARLFVDYPASDQYKLVTLEILDQRKPKYKIHILEPYGLMWREFQLTRAKRISIKKPEHGSLLHWVIHDGLILVFDAKREEATILNPSKFISIHHKPNPNARIWHCSSRKLVTVQGQLTFVHTYHKWTIIAVYNFESRNWRVSPAFEPRTYACLPIYIDGKEVLFLVGGGYLYEYDFDRNTIKKVADYSDISYGVPSVIYPFKPSLASVHETLAGTVYANHLPSIIAILDELKRCITI
ncbi:hypothetical protein KY290_033551 [Solanum tuberosum]|uniref:F-box domain-containing protein n=1 Tax=Solanum tuberosum TaxID=4113 RepID=A0ABQ7U2F3_SOLTU|nr:hypothetical protein KY290_033551 [Solanum tuberosum]